MHTHTYTPQDTAVITRISLSAIQKAITGKQIPTRVVGHPKRRRISEVGVIALALTRCLPLGLSLTPSQAYALLKRLGVGHATDLPGHISVSGSVRIDVREALAEPLRRLRLLRRARELIGVGSISDRGAAVIGGTNVKLSMIVDRLQTGDTIEAIQTDYPLLGREDIEAVDIWLQANPRRGRPKEYPVVDRLSEPTPRDVSAWTRTMQITAGQIDAWARSKEGQAALPRLVRRLVHATSSVTRAEFPAGDSISLPGWDGQLLAENATSWVPKGASQWEFSCEGSPTTKANKDYKKRTDETSKDVRRRSTIVLVTGRRWPQKSRWVKARRKEKKWLDVRAYDADDIEQWLEQSPAIALQFADELGLTGHGVESPTRYWDDWARQSDPTITPEAFISGRSETSKVLLAGIKERLNTEAPPLAIRADSVEEAAAFASSVLLSESNLSAVALVVTDPNGWRFVEKSVLVKVAIAARPEFAERPTRRKGLAVIIPYAAGDMADQFRGAAARANDPDITLVRPKLNEFENALKQMGVSEGDTQRLASITGRSWSVFRRRHALNPAIRTPKWLDSAQAQVLSTVCLVGAWSQDKAADRTIVERISGRTYEEIEQQLQELAQVDDAPVLMIGHVWKARSALELLDLFGKRITRGEFDRYMAVMSELFTAPNPELELPEEQRFAAGIYGKVRAESGLVFHSLCDTLMKLAVRGTQVSGLAALDVEPRIGAFVRGLLRDADDTRWLSLASLLPSLAEAAPDAFLECVETSLSKPDAPVRRLLTETSGSGITGRCWHAGLLWALETLAWAPERLTRVALVLARLSHTEIKGNWGNTPRASLLDLFRSWCPQTSATLDQRIAALDVLITREPDVAFQLLDRLSDTGSDTATPSARPHWRDDDAGAGGVASGAEMYGMLYAAADRVIACADGYPHRIAGLVNKVDQFDSPRVCSIIALVQGLTERGTADADREVVRSALRDKIHWHRNYGGSPTPILTCLPELERLYEALAPDDLITRHRWMFASDWPDFPERVARADFQARQNLVETNRIQALREIIDSLGLSGVSALALSCPRTASVGVTLGGLDIAPYTLADWIVKNATGFAGGDPLRAAFLGLLRGSPPARSASIIEAALELGRDQSWDNERIAQFLALARDERATWEIASSLGPGIENTYWRVCTPGFWIRDDKAALEYALQRLMTAHRPRTALQVCHMDFKTIDPGLLADLFELMLRGEELDGRLLDPWDIAQGIEALEGSQAIGRDRLARLEFGLIPALGFQGEQHTKVLYEEVMAKPELFAELLCLLYRSAGQTTREPASEENKAGAEIAWRLLRGCRRQPGTRPDGTIDAEAFTRFVDNARALALSADRLAVCDLTLGEILAHAPADADGTWPCLAVRGMLDRTDASDMRRGFRTGVFNKRGITSRSYDEGGGQERNLSQVYQGYARALMNSHPDVAATLTEVSQAYDRDATREDVQARLRLEGY